MTIEELKDEKLTLASAIMRLLRDFDDRTGVQVDGVKVKKYVLSCMAGDSYDYEIEIEVSM